MQILTVALLAFQLSAIQAFAHLSSHISTPNQGPRSTTAINNSNSIQLQSEDICFSNNDNNNYNMPSSITSATAAVSAASKKLRSVRKVLPRPPSHWVGDGFKVYPVFANLAFTDELSPLLMFDYGEPRSFPPSKNPNSKPLGVGQHPHRGFETVTVAFQGEVEHHDNAGNRGVIKAGDVQWMTAGRGIIHEEYHSKEFTRNGGTFEMCQLWVNLPKKDKMTKPGYQSILNHQIPVVQLPLAEVDTPEQPHQAESLGNEIVLGTARIIAGELGTSKGAATTFSPVQMWDVTLPHVGSEIDLPFPAEQNCILFVRRGGVEVINNSPNGSVQSTTLNPQEVALMRMDGGDTVRIRVLQPDSSILVLGGEPLNEPIAAHGPFVMNTKDEIQQAFTDYRLGKFGR